MYVIYVLKNMWVNVVLKTTIKFSIGFIPIFALNFVKYSPIYLTWKDITIQNIYISQNKKLIDWSQKIKILIINIFKARKHKNKTINMMNSLIKIVINWVLSKIVLEETKNNNHNRTIIYPILSNKVQVLRDIRIEKRYNPI